MLGAIGRQHPSFLTPQQTRENDETARRGGTRQVARHPHQRPGEDVGEDEVVTAAAPRPGGAANAYPVDKAIAPRMMAGDTHRTGIEIARQHGAAQGLGGGDREDAATGADIARTTKPPAARE